MKGFYYGWFFGFGYFLASLYWVTISLTFDQNFKFLIPFALILIPAFLAIFYGIAILCFFCINIKKPLSNLFLFSLLLGLFEFLRGTILTGFPWNLIAYSFSSNIEIIQVISLIGTYAFNILCISFFASPAIFFLKNNYKEIILCIFLLLLPIILHVMGSSKIKTFKELNVIKNDFVIRAIGSNIELERFYGNTDTLSVIKELIELSEPEFETKTIFIWPEGIIPNINQSELKEFRSLFADNFNNKHLLGIGINNQKKINDKDTFYNSFSFYNNQIELIQNYLLLKFEIK